LDTPGSAHHLRIAVFLIEIGAIFKHFFFQMKKLIFPLIAAATLCTGAVLAQQPCSTDAKYWEAVGRFPGIDELQKSFDAQVSNGMGRLAAKTTAGTYDDTTYYDIPVVVHVVHDYGVEYLADDDIYNAVAYWATIYVKHNPDTATVIPPFIPYIGNPKVRLHLATIDPNGKPTKGVVHHHSYLTNNADDEAKIGQWPPTQYVNVWFVKQFGAADAGAAAYAYLPSMASFTPYYDGIIGIYDYLNYDMAIPHEFGHVFNLYHPWGNTNSPGVACGDDNVDDTPPTKGHLPSGCTVGALYDTACATGYAVTYTSSLGTDSVVDYPDTVNAENIMDYTYCQKMFTKLQVQRMRNALTNTTAGRNNLWSAANIAATGATAPWPDLPPVADFSVERASGGGVLTDPRGYFMTINNPRNFQFRNRSWNDTVSSVSWTFSNGATTPTSTSMGIVANNFTVPGWVTVTLIANSNAGSDTLVNTQSVYVADTTSWPVSSGYYQPFTNASDIANWPMINYYGNQYKWEFYTGAGYGDSTCVRYRSRDTTARHVATALGDHDDLVTSAFNFSGVSGTYYLNFYTSSAKSPGLGGFGPASVGDSLEIDATTTGGDRWTKIVAYSSTQLVNNPTYGYEYHPTSASQWVARSVSIPSSVWSPNTYFRFRYWPGNIGNDFYMDNVALSPFQVGVDEVVKGDDLFKVYPNPANGAVNIVAKAGTEGKVNWNIKDIAGRIMASGAGEGGNGSIININVAREFLSQPGIYLVTVVVDGNSKTEKLTVY